ncbi:spore germination protein [Bacillus sp. OAE603]|uniref:spore germination protein n=1 Tax=Gottfriedia sp. OAE603 TaxID=2663872 RepID=UPI00178B1D6D
MEFSKEKFKNTFKSNVSIVNDINKNTDIIRGLFPTSDLVEKDLYIYDISAKLFHLAGLIDQVKLNDLMNKINTDEFDVFVKNNMTITNQVNVLKENILAGKIVLFFEDHPMGYIYATEKMPERSFSPPSIDNSLKGAKISFVETLQTNISLLRRFINSNELQVNQSEIGKMNKKNIAIAYVESVVDYKLLHVIKEKISLIEQDKITNSNQLAQLIEEYPFSPFPQIFTTERPDEAASEILAGRIAIILDSSSDVIILPAPFLTFFKSIDDYSSRSVVASFNRILRVAAILITLFLPGIYISIISYNFEIVPVKLLLSIGESRARVPFDPLIEAFLMEFTLEMLREAAIRLPSPISTTVGVVGGIVIGQAAVQAAIVSNIMVIVVALTAISSFIIPNYEMASSLRVIRFPIMIMASFFGLVGLMISTLILIIHVLTLKSFAYSYSSPFSPVKVNQLLDTFIRAPLKYIWRPSKKK